MRRVLFLILSCSMLFHAVFSQVKISGTITDSLKKPVEDAAILLKNGSVISKFTRTNSTGAFVLMIDNTPLATEHFVIEIKSFGYKTILIDYDSKKSIYDAVLKLEATNLDVVTVKYKPSITKIGDTLNYRTADFANSTDRTIGDVLKNMPGIKVEENGRVLYNNTPISSLYIDGDNLLDQKYNIGTQSIPHKAVAKIQVIDHDQPIKMLQKDNSSNDVAINLVIDKSAKLGVIGNANIALGVPQKFDDNIDVMLFKPNIKLLDNISLNNIGKDISDNVISYNDAFDLNKIENNRPGFQLSSGVSEAPYLPKNRRLLNNSGLINTNYLYKINIDKQLTINFYYLHDKRTQETNSSSTFFLPGDTINYHEMQRNNVNNKSLYTQLNYTDNASSHFLNNKFSVEYSPGQQNSEIAGTIKPFSQTLNQQRFNIINKIKSLTALSSGTILDINSYTEYTNHREDLTVTPGINQDFLNANIDYSMLNQHVNVPGFFSNNYITYSTVKNRFTQFYQVGFNFQHINFDSNLEKLQNGNSWDTVANGINDATWNKLKIYINPRFDYKTENLSLSLSTQISNTVFDYHLTQTPPGSTFGRLVINPSLAVQYRIGSEYKLNVSYGYSNKAGRIEDIYTGLLLKNYRSLTSNDSPLPFTQNHSASFGFRFQQPATLLFASVQINYNVLLADNIVENVITNTLQTRKTVALPNQFENLTITHTVGKYFLDLNTNVGANVNLAISSGSQIQNGQLLPYHTTNMSLGLNTNTKIGNSFNISYKADYNQNKNTTENEKPIKFYQVKQVMDANYSLLKRITLGSNLTHLIAHQPSQSNLIYLFTDLYVKYKWLKRKIDFEFNINNLANIQSFDTYSIDLNSRTSANYRIPGRNFLLRAVFSIK